MTEDVSRHGVFVATSELQPERELMECRFLLPSGKLVEVMGMIARTVSPEDDGLTGMGVDFFVLSKENKRLWDAFVTKIERVRRIEPMRKIPELEIDPPEDRREQRQINCFMVRLKEKKALSDFYSREVVRGGMFLKTPVPPEVGSGVELVLIHPDSHLEYKITGTVSEQRKQVSVRERGVGIEFHPRTGLEEAALMVFLETGHNLIDEGPMDRAAEKVILRRALELGPHSPMVLLCLGESLLAAGDTHMAANAFLKILDTDPQSLDAYQALHRTYLHAGDTKQAARALAAVKRIQGTD